LGHSEDFFVGFPGSVAIYLKTMTSDLELLEAYARENSEESFAALVNRHLNLVYSAALRQVRSPQLAEEVAQSVFTDLSRNAAKLKPDTILTAWLYQVTRRTAIDVVRREARRQLREQIATEMNTLNTDSLSRQSGTPADEWSQVEPMLDDAMATLDAADRTAVLLRYFENKSLREVGAALGTSDDAAQKRVSRAVERLREFLAKRGVTVGAGGLVVVLAANAVQAAPVGLAVTIATAAALAGAGVSTSTALAASQTVAMTTIQKASIIAIVFASVVTPLVIQQQAQAKLRNQEDGLRQRADQLAKLQAENKRLSNLPALTKSPQPLPDDQLRDLLRLRGEVGRLRRDVLELSRPEAKAPLSRDDKLASIAMLYADRVSQLKQSLEANPSERIPELRLLTDSQWLQLSSTPEFDPENGYRRAMSKARGWAENGFVNDQLKPALQGYAKANNGQFPSDVSQLKPYFNSVVEDAILQRWEIVPANELARYMTAQALGAGDDRLIAPKEAVNLALDMPTVCSLSKVTAFASKPANQWVRAR
jgi:RNA polymerase sigma factor (sigma-70 family)